MSKIASLLLMLVLLNALAFGQARSVSGQVKDNQGRPVPFVTVTVKGTSNAKSADENGNFTIQAAPNATLVFTAAGYQATEQNIGTQTSIAATINSPANTMNEVIVTALGIRREKRELSTATQTISSDQLNTTGTGNPLSEMNGKASGLTVINSAGDPGSGTYIRLRGVTSITGNNQPLMVVDGVPIDNSINNYDATSANPNVSGANSNLTGGVQPTNRGVDINPADIESVTLLKGPAATALYGIQAASGAIIITTKKGGGRGTHISFNSSFTADQVNKLPGLQRIYSQGSGGVFSGPPRGSGRRTTWGALIDTLAWDGIPTEWDPHGTIVGKSNPSAKFPVTPYDIYDFFQTGLTFNNNIALSGGDSKTNYRMSLGNLHQTGIIPKTKYDKTTFSINGQTAISDRLSVSAGINYIRSANDKAQQGSNTSGVMLGLVRTPPTFDNANGLSDPEDNPDSYVLKSSGEQRSYRGTAGYDNPYWTVNRVPFHEDLNRAFGFGQASFRLFDWMTLGYRLGGDIYQQTDKNAYDIGSNAFSTGAIHVANYFNEQFNSDFTVNMRHAFNKDLSGSLLLGHNYFTTNARAQYQHGTDFIVPTFFDLSNAKSFQATELNTSLRRMAFYGEAHLDYLDRLYLTLTGRRETSSTLPEKNNSFFYPSAGLSYEFTKSEFAANSKFLSYGKLRASFAQVGKDAPVQGLQTWYTKAAFNDGFTTGIQFPFNGVGAYQLSSTIATIGNPDLKAEKTNSYELGADLGFWNNKVTLNATAYYSKSTDVILIVPIAYSTGFAAELLNAATLTNKGLELTLNTTPVKTNNFRWDLNFNWARNINKVASLAQGIDRVLIAGFQNGEVDAIAGKPFGVIYGSIYVRSDPNNFNSPLLINDDKNDPGYGMPIVATQNAPLGDINPQWTGSVLNTLAYKNFSLYVQLDVRHGGKLWNGTRGAMSYFGTSAETANRGKPVTFNGILGHLNANGDVVHYAADGVTEIDKPGAANTVATTYSQYYWQNIGSSFIGPAEIDVEDGSFVRIRQISLSYNFPASMLKHSGFTNLGITVFTNNPVLWTKYTGVDPETSLAGPANGQGLDYFNNPGTRNWGIRLSLGL